MSDPIDNDVEHFIETMTKEGIATATVIDGIMLAVTTEKLRQLLEVAEKSDRGQVIIFIKNDLDVDKYKQ